MSSPPSRLRRVGSVLVLLLQVCALAVWPALDPGVHAPTAPHIEAPGSAKCPPAHDESRCQICQASAVRLAAAQVAPVNLALAVETRLAPTAPKAPIRRVVKRHRRSRSPPVRLA